MPGTRSDSGLLGPSVELVDQLLALGCQRSG